MTNSVLSGKAFFHRSNKSLLQLSTTLLMCALVFSGCGGSSSSSSGESSSRSSSSYSSGSSSSAGSQASNTSLDSAYVIPLGSSGTGSVSADLAPGEQHYYEVSVNTSGRYVISTTGSVDTVGTLYNQGQSTLAENDDSGDGSNFRIEQNLQSGTYYIQVRGYSENTSGQYTILISRESSGNGSYQGEPGNNVGGQGDISWVLTWGYFNSEVEEGPDLDLWVMAPNDTQVYYDNANPDNINLRLDFDDRGGFGQGDGGGPERIHSTGELPLGTYTFGVRWFSGDTGSADYTIRLYHNENLIGTETGTLTQENWRESIEVGEVVLTDDMTGSSSGGGGAPAPTVTGKLNDTGIDWCADANTNNLNCPVSGFEGQDGEHGRDAQARAGTLNKVGAGAAGFDFTKLNANGDTLPASASQWSCVRDNHTGLIWEVKTTDGGLRDANNTYTWYNPDSNTNGGDAGTQDGGICTGSDCDTYAYVQAVNEQGLCGANDWQLPNRLELLSIMHNGQVLPAIDTDWFPNSQETNWSSSPSAFVSDFAWTISFDYGVHRSNARKDRNYRVRLVRSGQ